MRVAKQLFQEKYTVTNEWQATQTYKILENLGFVHFLNAGLPIFLPVGKRIVDKICAIIRAEAEKHGFNEVYLPLLQERRLLAATGRADVFASELLELTNGLDGFIVTPTNEEVFLELARHTLLSYRNLPVRWFQIADKFRNIQKPKGLLRTRQFLMCDMVSIDASWESLYGSAALFEATAAAVFKRIGLPTVRVSKSNNHYVDFLVPCAEGETKVVLDADAARYATPADSQPSTASSVAMYFIFEHAALGAVHYQGEQERAPVLLGTYGFGIQRCLHAVMDVYRDDLGIGFPASIRPFDVAICVLDADDPQQLRVADQAYDTLQQHGYATLYDDRVNKSLGEKAKLADFYGIPYKLIIGSREVASNTLTLKRRGAQQAIQVPSNIEALIKTYFVSECTNE